MVSKIYTNLLYWLINLPRRIKIIFSILLDFFILILLTFFAYFLRIENIIYNDEVFRDVLIISIIFSLLMIFVSLLRNNYKEISRYSDFNTFNNLFLSTVIFLISSYIIKYFLLHDYFIPRSVPIIFFILINIFFICKIFILKKILIQNTNAVRIRTIIFGINDNLKNINYYLKNNPNYLILSYVDNDPRFNGTRINGIKVINQNIFLKKYKNENVDLILLDENIDNIAIIKKILSKNFDESKLKNLKEIIYGNIFNNEIIDLIISRKENKLDTKIISKFLNNKTFLVAGAAGTIGFEIFKILFLQNMSKKIILIDQSEYGLYKIKQFLNKQNIQNNIDNIELVLADLKSYDGLEEIFKKNKIDIVYNAAAYKHVNIVEDSNNSNYAFKNNVLISDNLCKLSNNYLIEHCVLISSDKAVEPSNVMGISKRVSEILFQNYSLNSNTSYKIVRFGNVIGSSGSVINNFINQFNEGGPITLTDKKVERYFMTINEAASLVIETISHGQSGDILFLDMGKSIFIYDILTKLAINFDKKIVEEKTKNNNEIFLKIIGLQKGEKLKEKLFHENEKEIEKTSNQKINIIVSKNIFNKKIEDFINNSEYDLQKENLYKILD